MAPTLAIVPADTADLRTLTTRDGARLASASARALDGLLDCASSRAIARAERTHRARYSVVEADARCNIATLSCAIFIVTGATASSRAEMPTPAVRADRARDWMTEQLRTAASPRLCAYLVAPGLQPTFIAWQRLWRPTLASRGVCWRSIIAATANPNMTAIPTTTRFLWALADLSAVIIGKV
jgi:hypothetical protein